MTWAGWLIKMDSIKKICSHCCIIVIRLGCEWEKKKWLWFTIKSHGAMNIPHWLTLFQGHGGRNMHIQIFVCSSAYLARINRPEWTRKPCKLFRWLDHYLLCDWLFIRTVAIDHLPFIGAKARQKRAPCQVAYLRPSILAVTILLLIWLMRTMAMAQKLQFSGINFFFNLIIINIIISTVDKNNVYISGFFILHMDISN